MRPINKAWCCQIDVTSYCPHACLYCSRYSKHLRADQRIHMDKDQFVNALESLREWPGKIGIIGGEPLLHPQFREFNGLIRDFVKSLAITIKPGGWKFGLWTSGIKSLPDPRSDADIKATYGFINYNPHSEEQLKKCRHQPLTVAISEVITDEQLMWQLIDNCWVQRMWCPTITHKGAYFCEVGAAQDILLNDGKNAWPVTKDWWRRGPDDEDFIAQRNALCPHCGMPIPMDRELIEKQTEKITPRLLQRFKDANLNAIADTDLELYDVKLSRASIIEKIDDWHPGNYREDIRADEPTRKGFIGTLEPEIKPVHMLKTHHGSYVAFNRESNTLYHGYNWPDFINSLINDNDAELMFNGHYITPDKDLKFGLSDSPSKFAIIKNSDNTISLKVGDRFLSATLAGNFTFQPHNRAWERFTPGENEKYLECLKAFNSYTDALAATDSAKLACCCSSQRYRGNWFHTDIKENPDQGLYYLDISKKFPIANNRLNYIYIEHGIGHTDINGVINFMQEAYRTLDYNGVLRIASPGLDNWIKYYIVNDDFYDKITDKSISIFENHFKPKWKIRSKAIAINNMMRNYGHLCVLDFVTYKELLKRAGFCEVVQGMPHQSRWPQLMDIESRKGEYSDFETLVIEARK